MKNKGLLKSIEKPLAIAMWDFSWMRAEGFGDIVKAIDELQERGYNAVRLDVFPASINTYMEKGITMFTYPGTGERDTIWGNTYEVKVNTPEKVELIFTECKKRGIYIGISSWIGFALEDDTDIDLKGFKKIWDNTLKFLAERDLLHNIIYVDLMNEYPVCNGFNWVRTKALDKTVKNEHSGLEHIQRDDTLKFDDSEAAVWRRISSDLLDYFHEKWKNLDFTISVIAATYNYNVGKYTAMEKLDTLDAHIWLVFHKDLFQDFFAKSPFPFIDEEFKDFNKELFKAFDADREKFFDWIGERIEELASWADKYGITLGNTEGWGIVLWRERPSAGWDFIKMAAERIIPICKKHKCFKYICTSNFTHPMFNSLWEDIEWHKKVTGMIKNG